MVDKEDRKLAKQLRGSYWNYRWLKYVVDTPKINDDLEVVEGETDQEVYYELHEVYYDKKNKPFMWTENATKAFVYDGEDLVTLVQRMLDAAMKKVLIVEDNEIRELDEYIDKQEALNSIRGDNNE